MKASSWVLLPTTTLRPVASTLRSAASGPGIYCATANGARYVYRRAESAVCTVFGPGGGFGGGVDLARLSWTHWGEGCRRDRFGDRARLPLAPQPHPCPRHGLTSAPRLSWPQRLHPHEDDKRLWHFSPVARGVHPARTRRLHSD